MDKNKPKMKVLLVNPNRYFYPGAKGPRNILPLGLMYVAAYLEKMGIDVRIFECLLDEHTEYVINKGIRNTLGVNDEYFKEVIREEAPDIVGVGIPFTAQLEAAVKATELIKEANPDITVVAGGPHVSAVRGELLKEIKTIDYGIIGEGEIAFYNLVESIRDGKPCTDLPGLIYRTQEDGASVIRENQPELIEDLDEIPYPAYHLIDMDLFFGKIKKGVVGRAIKGHTHSISMVTSRGCPFDCVFCSIHIHMGRRHRAHSADYVAKHIKYVADKYGITHISFEDDNFNANRKRCIDMFNRLIEDEVTIKWNTTNGLRADILDEELLLLMKKTGCECLTIAPESGSQHTLDTIINKKMDLKKIIRTAELCKKIGINVISFFVIGLPGETIKDMQKTVDFAIWLYEEYDATPSIFSATPLIGTKLYDIAVDNNYFVRDITPENYSKATQPIHGEPMLRTADFTPEDVKALAQQFDKRREVIMHGTTFITEIARKTGVKRLRDWIRK